ncbi:MAG: sulfurtransferase TusA family protein [Chloroflexi bacterium]|nr:sulfurtransferase TusA family protein [Chloroflexota bacterium]
MTDASPVPGADLRLDAVGQDCATLTPIVAARMRQMRPGEILEVISDDPTARTGLAAWSRLTGNALFAIQDDGSGPPRYYFRRK